ncbi:acetyl-CoA carboxylase biotin carboxylase subunit [Deltaproteobacteria bacterium OttesenSCG-928-K17]|nr:acetyl-CoA carboxylase biotin carboxylase subunit [Deltaproteobacteria bacterium OttesenSCG-928-K17]
MFKKIVIANRGAVAARLVETLASMNVASVALYSEADANLPYVAKADESLLIGPGPAPQSYLNQDAVLEAAIKTGADAIHPGYGFLAENDQFAEKVIAAGLSFIGPDPKWLKIMGDKTASKEMMAAEGFPISPSTGILTGEIEDQARQAAALGFPLLIKPAGGGGGIGMTSVFEESKLAAAIESASKLAARSFGRPALYAERLLENPRHVEFQIVADRHGNAVHLFERDCSTQRRRQKVVEEAGAPNIPAEELAAMADRAASAMRRLGYDHLGTVESLYSPGDGFSFLEVNPRLQVEHGVTEEITGLDLVKIQIKLAAGESVDQALPHRPKAPQGHAVEARIYAEDPVKFFPSPGPLKVFRPPQGKGVRVETGFCEGAVVTPFYDPMIAMVIVHAETRPAALDLMHDALGDFAVEGIKTNIPFVRDLMKYGPFREGRVHTGIADEYFAAK